jgi:type IV secretion system protein VirB11
MRPGERTLRNLLADTLQPYLDDPRTTEVVVNQPGEIGVEQSGKWSWFDCPSLTFNKLDAIAILSASMTNREVDGSRPLCGSTLPDGQRIHICRPSATLPGVIALCIRKPPTTPRKLEAEDMEELFSEANTGVSRHSEVDIELLKLYHDRKWVEFLSRAVKSRKTIGATGLTGSGKSDFLRRLLGAIPESDRVVTIESDPEFGDVGPRNRINLFYNDDRPKQQAIDVVNASLRLYPKTLAFQEVRGPEAFPLMRGIISGHNSFTSWHADEGDEIGAMAVMLRQNDACRAMAEEQLTAMVRRCFDIIVSHTRDGGKFRVTRVWFRAAEEMSCA